MPNEEYDPTEAIWPHGPIMNPTDRFVHLPAQTREWLEHLREDDLQELNETVKFMRMMRSWGRVTKWLILILVGVFLGAVAVGEGVSKIFGWFFRGVHS